MLLNIYDILLSIYTIFVEQQGEFTDDEADDDSTNDDVGSDSDQAADDAIVSARSSQQRNKG